MRLSICRYEKGNSENDFFLSNPQLRETTVVRASSHNIARIAARNKLISRTRDPSFRKFLMKASIFGSTEYHRKVCSGSRNTAQLSFSICICTFFPIYLFELAPFFRTYEALINSTISFATIVMLIISQCFLFNCHSNFIERNCVKIKLKVTYSSHAH